MPAIQLLVYLKPTYLEAIVNLRRSDGSYEWRAMMVDTGAPISLFPITLLDRLDFRLTQKEGVIIHQAGIALQQFEAVEAIINLYLEDQKGNRSPYLEAPAWFAKTTHAILGFEGILDRSILHMDMLNSRAAWVEF